MEIKNAIIESATLSKADHGVLSGWLHLDYGGSGQGFGGYCLYNPNFDGDSSGKWLWRIMETLEVYEWGEVVGKTIRVKADHGKVHAIGHILKDQWFCPSEEFKK